LAEFIEATVISTSSMTKYRGSRFWTPTVAHFYKWYFLGNCRGRSCTYSWMFMENTGHPYWLFEMMFVDSMVQFIAPNKLNW